MNNSSEQSLSRIFKDSSINTSAAWSAGTLDHHILLTDLLKVIFNRIHPLYLVDCGAVLIYDQQLTVIKEAFISTFLNENEDVSIYTTAQPSELTAVQKIIAEFSYPVIKSSKEWIAEESTNHTLVNNVNHYNYHCYIPLEIDNKVVGTLELHNENRELNPESLTFCSNIADFLAELIRQVRSQAAINIKASSAGMVNAKNSVHTINNNDTDQLQKLKEQISQVNQSTTLESFIDQSSKLFPSAFGKLKFQLDEIRALSLKIDNNNLHTHEEIALSSDYPEIVGSGKAMAKVFSLLDRVADTDATVLILGETGTGKELIAKAIHRRSSRKEQPMIMINCAAIPANLIESELFGHEKGAFTGATDKRIGKFELAEGGTLFLDEIGEMPLDLQVKLLRALQEKEIERVGGKTVIKTNVRVISATNRDLLEEVEKGRFRRDLYFRLNVFPVTLPALRDRIEDIPLLAMHFLNKYAGKKGKQLTGFSKGAIKQMREYNWPGNIREMEHLIERQVLLNTKSMITDLPITIKEKTKINSDGLAVKIKTIDENERDHIFEVLQLCKGRISGANGAAKLLGVPATTLNSKIKRLGLNKKHF